MKIACFQFDRLQKNQFEKIFSEIKVFSGPLSEKNIGKVLDTEIIVSRPKGSLMKFDSRVLSKFKDLKIIFTMSTGFDHIDLAYCKIKGIHVCNVPSYSESSVAEQTFALILSISRKMLSSSKKGPNKNKNLTGFELKGKILGVIGSGKIGLEVIKIAKGFGMNILAYDVVKNQKASQELVYEYVKLDDLMRESDIITVHAPYNEHTYHLLNKDNLSIVKKGCVLINTSRGELVESRALYNSIKSKRLSAAGLDVLEKGSKYNRGLIRMRNVILTPHNSANTIESKNKVLEETIKNIASFIKGEIRNEI